MRGTAMQAPGTLGQMRPLGSTGIQVSAVGLGTWAMGAQWGPQEDQESLRTLHHRWTWAVSSSTPPRSMAMGAVSN